MTSCVVKQFPTPSINGINILGIEAVPVYNETAGPYLFESLANFQAKEINFCNVTVTYTHPQENDTVHVNIWLPLDTIDWNGRFQGAGGGGFSGSLGPMSLAPAVAHGYAVAATDSGHNIATTLDESMTAPWALLSPGHIEYHLLEEFGSISLNDMTLIGKNITESYYENPPHHSYWNGCSNGGRQGLMIAQRYPDLYDGIVAAAPAVDFTHLFTTFYWPTQVMKSIDKIPPQAELEALRLEAIKVCDKLDGLEDGIIGLPERCDFDPYPVIGNSYQVEGVTGRFTHAGAKVVSAVWKGPWSEERDIGYYGLNPDASFSRFVTIEQLPNGSNVNIPNVPGAEWLKDFVAKDPDFAVGNITDDDYFSMFQKAVTEYDHILDPNNPDLLKFRRAGGKMLTWHGIADEAVMPESVQIYMDKVLGLDPAASDFYRLFMAPGAFHCQAGLGAIPANTLETLVKWVEEGKAPATLEAVAINGSARPLCVYPLEQVYVGPDPQDAGSFTCVAPGSQGQLRLGQLGIGLILNNLRSYWTGER